MNTILKPLFLLGQIVSTPGALSALGKEGIDARSLLDRHANGDWGEMSEDDRRENNLAATEGFRILSAYTLPLTGVKLWVITEADRSATTLLLPDEY
jgi:hypothetical protein